MTETELIVIPERLRPQWTDCGIPPCQLCGSARGGAEEPTGTVKSRVDPPHNTHETELTVNLPLFRYLTSVTELKKNKKF